MADEMLIHAEGKAFIADTGYDSARTIENARKLGMLPVIHPHPSRKKRRRINRQLYAIRYRIECFFHSLKRFRAVATRYDKTSCCYLAVLHIASMILWLH
jgi:transposase